MRSFTVLSSFIFFIFFSPKVLSAQQESVPDSLWQSLQLSNAAKLFSREFSGPNSPVYQGYQYVPYILPISGNPFFMTNKWQQRTIDFEGKIYKKLSLLYDIKKNQLVLQSSNKQYRILVPPEKVNAFTIGNDHFIRIVRENINANNKPASGYYQELVTGNVSLLAKRRKKINMPTIAGMPRNYVTQNNYYIEKDNRYYKVRTKRSMLKALSDQKKGLKRYLRKNDLSFNKNSEKALMEAVQYYDRIKP